MVATSEGVLYSYSLDLENGGEAVLQKSYSYVLCCQLRHKENAKQAHWNTD